MATQNITFRVEESLVRVLRAQAEQNDRTLNGEFRAILRKISAKKASGHVAKQSPDAFHK